MSSAPVAVARVTTVCPLSQPQDGEGLGPPASRSTVGCKPGHDSPWDTITETSVKGSDAINHKDGRREVSEKPPFLWLPFLVRIPAVQVTAAFARHTQAHVGRARVVRRRTGSVRSTRFRLARFLRGSFLSGFCRGFRSCRGAGEGVLFPGQRRAQSLQDGLPFWKAQPNTTRAPTRRLEGPVAQPTEEPQEEVSFAIDHEVKGERTHIQHWAPTRLPRPGIRPMVRLGRWFGLTTQCAVSLVTSVVGL